MRTWMMVACVVATPVVAGPVTSMGDVPLPPGVVKTAAATPDKVMCVSEDETGSRLSTNKICHSASDWLYIKQHQGITPAIQPQALGGCGGITHC